MLKSVKSRLTLLYVAILALILTAFSASLYAGAREELSGDFDRALAGHALAFSEFYLQSPRPEEIDAYLHLVRAQAAVVDAQGASLYRSRDLRSAAALDADRLREGYLTAGTRRFHVSRARDGAGRERVVAFGQDRSHVDRRLDRLLAFFALFVPIVLLVSWYVGFLFVRGALAPVEEIRRRAQLLSRENLSERVPLPRTRGELRELAATFNEMLARLEAAFSQTQAFTANASHELKTPLANLRTGIELALEKEADAEEYQRLLAGIGEEVSRLTRIVENLLLLAQLDRGAARLQRETVDLSAVVREAVGDVRLAGEARGVAVREGLIAPDVRVLGDSVMLRRVVLNLLENGVKHNREGGEVRCSVWREDSTARIEVADDGPGIRAEALPHLFERFYRGDSPAAGSGLGLSICKSLVEAHGGRIEIRSREGAGTTFHVSLPAGVIR